MARSWLRGHSVKQEAPGVRLWGSWMLYTPSLIQARKKVMIR